MKEYFKTDEWLIIEEGLDPNYNRVAESVMSLGNGYMGIRGNFEEKYSGDMLQGTYYAGIYYPDKTKVGWWKNGYPEWFAKVLNGINFIGINVKINGLELDLSKCKFKNFKRILNMKEGYLKRSFIVIDDEGNESEIVSQRFLSMADSHNAVIKYMVKPINHDAFIELTPYLNGNVRNEDSNYDEIFWEEVNKGSIDNICYLTTKTKKIDFHVTCAMKYDVEINNKKVSIKPKYFQDDLYVENYISTNVKKGEEVAINKYIIAVTSRDYPVSQLVDICLEKVSDSHKKGYDLLFKEHCKEWDYKWKENDITIVGDAKAQQGVRFNIFQLNQTYTGEDPRLNIGPKGFTGEKYGGSTYWDTEAFCLPFYLSTASSKIAKNLLIYRYNHLEKAKENARKLGLKGALYPMVTMNGEECHNEWEITFEEIHRNGAIAYAIYNYINYTGDKQYLVDYGFEVLVEISRFWADRVNYNKYKDKYMIIGVTGPNEYENNVNNNWYTNTIATWTLEYTIKVKKYLEKEHNDIYLDLCKKINFKTEEISEWNNIIDKMYYPIVKELGIFEQQDGYMDKEQKLINELDPSDLPINQNWSWDKILRSCLIKQADVLQGLYIFDEKYDIETKKRNFDFYEPRTTHESSLSPCIYSIIASQIGYKDKAYELYLRTARLDVDNYNNDSKDGLHITSMAGSWMSIVHGFGGMHVVDGELYLSPFLPEKWKQYSFRLVFKERIINVQVNDAIIICLEEGEEIKINIYNNVYLLNSKEEVKVNILK